MSDVFCKFIITLFLKKTKKKKTTSTLEKRKTYPFADIAMQLEVVILWKGTYHL